MIRRLLQKMLRRLRKPTDARTRWMVERARDHHNSRCTVLPVGKVEE